MPRSKAGAEILRIDQMHSGLVRILRDRLPVEPMVLAARVGMGAEMIAQTVAADGAGVIVDPVVVGARSADLSLAVTRAILSEELAAVTPNLLGIAEAPSPSAVELAAETYGRRVGLAIELAADRLDSNDVDWTVADALGSSINERLLVVNHADRLDPRALWELRDVAAAGAQLLLMTTPEHHEKLCGPKAAFFGFGSYTEMPVLSVPIWTSRLSPHFDSSAVTELFRQATGRTGIMLDVICDREPGDEGFGAAWLRAVGGRDHEVRTLMSVAPKINELAPFLLMAIAHGEPPYGRDDRPDRIARVLRHLRELDLTEQPEPRKWRIADPLMAAALRRLRTGHVETFPHA